MQWFTICGAYFALDFDEGRTKNSGAWGKREINGRGGRTSKEHGGNEDFNKEVCNDHVIRGRRRRYRTRGRGRRNGTVGGQGMKPGRWNYRDQDELGLEKAKISVSRRGTQ